jgi:hypothetical protein
MVTQITLKSLVPNRLRIVCANLLLLNALLVVVGCGRGGFSSVEGTVQLDGKELDGGSVTFYPVNTGPVSYGDISSGGAFHLRTASHDGVIPGQYVATVSYRSGHPSPTMTIKEVEALEKVPIRYCTKERSDLRVEVKPGKNTVDLKMTTNN